MRTAFRRSPKMLMDSRCESDAADSYPDETLVEGWLNGDGDAIEKLVTRYMPRHLPILSVAIGTEKDRLISKAVDSVAPYRPC